MSLNADEARKCADRDADDTEEKRAVRFRPNRSDDDDNEDEHDASESLGSLFHLRLSGRKLACRLANRSTSAKSSA